MAAPTASIGLPPHGVKCVLEAADVHLHVLHEDLSLLKGHGHGCAILCTLTAGDTPTVQSPAQLEGGRGEGGGGSGEDGRSEEAAYLLAEREDVNSL